MGEVRLKTVLIGMYELGRQSFGMASAAAWLRHAGASVTCLDLAVQQLDEDAVVAADLVAFHLPMHTATRLALPVMSRVKALNGGAHLCCFGLYAPMNEHHLRHLGAGTILGGEFEAGLAALAMRLGKNRANRGHADQSEPVISLERQAFLLPDRRGLPAPSRYAYLDTGSGEQRVTGYTEASRGCKHRCRHCPVVPVYDGTFRIVQADVVLEDIAQQVAAGAQHVTFGDPDFFNGPGHALRIVEALHRRFPDVTYDVTIKVEHLLRHARHLPKLRHTGCVLITSAVEAVDDGILSKLEKRHTREDFVRIVALCREVGIALNPTFMPFTPWTTLEGFRELLALICALGLVESVAPVQYAIRLLIPEGSRLLELAEVRGLVGQFDEPALCYPWMHPDPRVDALHAAVRAAVQRGVSAGDDRSAIFDRIWEAAVEVAGEVVQPLPGTADWLGPVPRLSEPWYC